MESQSDISVYDLRWYFGAALVHITCYLETYNDIGSCPPPCTYSHCNEFIEPVGYMFTTSKNLVSNMTHVLSQEHTKYAVWLSECRYIADKEKIKLIHKYTEDRETSLTDEAIECLTSLKQGILLQVHTLQEGLIFSMLVEINKNNDISVSISKCRIHCFLTELCETAWQDIARTTKDHLDNNSIVIYNNTGQLFNGESIPISEMIHSEIFGPKAFDA